MAKIRNTSKLAPLTPAADLPASPTGSLTEMQWMQKLIASERRRHGQVESILTRTITGLESQVTDLRNIILQMTAQKLVKQ